MFEEHTVAMTAQGTNHIEKLGYSVRGLANWILDYADDIGVSVSNMALNKLLYFAYEEYLHKYNAAITNAKIEAWEHGPVFREVYQSFKGAGDKPIRSRASFFNTKSMNMETSNVDLPIEVQKRIASILSSYMPLSASRLRHISHRDSGPWHKVWWYRGAANPGMEITLELILASRERGGADHEDC